MRGEGGFEEWVERWSMAFLYSIMNASHNTPVGCNKRETETVAHGILFSLNGSDRNQDKFFDPCAKIELEILKVEVVSTPG